MSLRPSESFAGIMRFVRFITRSVGVDAYDPKYRINPLTLVTASVIMLYLILTAATIVKEGKENWMLLVQTLAMGCTVTQGINKMWLGVFSAGKVCELYTQIKNIYTTYELESDPRYAEVLLQNCQRLRRGLFLVGISYLVGITGMIVVPIIATIITGTLYLPMHVYIPGVDMDTDTGAWFTQALQAVCIGIGGFGLYAGDMLIIVDLAQCFVYADILRLKVDGLNTYVQRLSDDTSQRQSSKMLIGIAQWHQTYLNYVAECNNLFYVMVSVQIVTAAVCIVMTIFALLTSHWLGGCLYICVIVPEMYLYCIMGTKLEDCNESIIYEIYNIAFYDLTVSQQRFVLIMLTKSQQPDYIQLLGVMPLSVSTALQISKSIYSITMMMVQFLDI